MPAIYQADTWCDSCADSIRQQLNPNNLPIGGENEYDSDEYPKHMEEDEEGDTPQHCGSGETCLEAETLPSGAKIGKLLSRTLTDDGVEYVKGYILGGGGNEVANWWKQEFEEAGYDFS